MPVAKSFQSFEMLTEPYAVSGKQYVKVRNPKTGTERQVRWYSESEFVKLYPEAKVAAVQAQDAFYKPQKEVLGFTKGYITIFKGDTYSVLDWFRSIPQARYSRWWGWYIISTEEVPETIPAQVAPVRLIWETVGNEDGKLKPEHIVQKAVEALIYDAGTSEYVGNIGERLELTVSVVRNIKLDNGYGSSNMHIMEDADGNNFIWTTSAKDWAEGSVKHIRGTVKDHRTYKNVKQNILNRCMEVK